MPEQEVVGFQQKPSWNWAQDEIVLPEARDNGRATAIPGLLPRTRKPGGMPCPCVVDSARAAGTTCGVLWAVFSGSIS